MDRAKRACVRRGAATVILGWATVFALAVAPAWAANDDWMLWVHTNAGDLQTAIYHQIYQTESQGQSYESCTNMSNANTGNFEFADNYCASGGYTSATPQLGTACDCAPDVWNASSTYSDFDWGWRYLA